MLNPMATLNDNVAPSTATSSVVYCLYCGYSLVGSVSSRCPECGNRIPATKDITFLPWERIKDGNLPLRFARTLLDGALRPRRMFQHLRERSQIPVIRTRELLALAVGAALAVSFIGLALECIVPTVWRQGSLPAGFRVFWTIWWRYGNAYVNASHAVSIVSPVLQMLFNTIVASFMLWWVQRASRKPGLSFGSLCVGTALLFFPIFVILTFIAFLELFLLTLSLPGGLFTGGYLYHIMILACSLALFFIGVTGLEISRRRMLGAAVAFCFGSWFFLFITIDLAFTAPLVLYGQK